MKALLLVFLFVACNGLVRANTYYFSSTSGNDAYSAAESQHPETPWRTLAQLNQFFSQLNPGDSIFFLRGDIFDGNIIVQSSGTSSSPIVIGAYGEGNKPVINGFFTLATWSNSGNGIYEAPLVAPTGLPNMLTYNGEAHPLGRFPNADAAHKGYLNFESHDGNHQVTDDELTSSTDWTGAELVIRKNRWTTERAAITRHDGSIIQYTPVSSWDPIDHYGYFFQNSLKTLDQEGEWFYDKNSGKVSVYFGGENPAAQQIRVANVQTLVTIQGQQHIIFEGLSFQGANEIAVKMDNATNIQFLSCDILYSGSDAFIMSNTDQVRLSSCLVENTFNNALTGNDCRNTVIRENYFRYTGMFAGMGKNEGSYEAIILKGSNNLIELNYFDQTGYVPITFNGDQTIIRQNVINHFSFVKDDGGAIYTWNNYPEKRVFHDQQIVDNIILNGYGAGDGTSDPDYHAASGIYLDDNTSNVTINGNTVANCALSGIYIHNSHELHLENNTFFNNGLQLQIRQDEAGNAPVRNNFIYNNIFFAKTPAQYVSKVESTLNDIASFGNINGNYYCRPVDEGYPIFTSYGISGQIIGQTLNLPGWTARYQFDDASGTSPVLIPEYQTNSGSSPTKFTNGNFGEYISGLYCYSSTGNCNTSWNSGGKLDGGSLQYTYQASTPGSSSSSYVIIDIGAVSAGQPYVLKYSSLSSIANKKTSVFLRQSRGGYQDLTPRSYQSITSSRKENEVVFTPAVTENNASLVFELEENEDFISWFDNTDLKEATVTKTDLDNFFRFEYNGSTAAKNIALDGNYVDARNKKYSGTVTLSPFASLVLMRSDEAIMPVAVNSFKGNSVDDRIDLQWVTVAGETDLFEVERSATGIVFDKIGKMPTNGLKNNGRYFFADKNPLPGKNYYRIRQTDTDGTSSHPAVIMVKYPVRIKWQLSPNPARNIMQVQLDLPAKTAGLHVQVQTINGIVLKDIPLAPGADKVQVNTSSLKSGFYLLRVVGDDFALSKQFEVVR